LSRSREREIGSARHRLLADGVVPVDLVGAILAESWQRSLVAGLDPAAAGREMPRASVPQLARTREHHRELIDHALPAMAYLQAHSRDTGSVILLSNANGLLLESCGDAEFAGRVGSVHLAPGASWHERHRGTNAIGTTLALRTPTVVTGAEHFLACNDFLTCAAAPIFDSRGELLGVLNISGDQRSSHPHTSGLVRTAAQMIENRLFLSRHGGDLRLHLHPLAEGIGTLAEGVVAIGADGWVVGANPAGLALLGISSADLCRTRIDQLLSTRIDALTDWAARRTTEPLFLMRPTRPGLFVRVDMPRSSVSLAINVTPPAADKPCPDAFAVLDSGDERMSTAIARARRILHKAIPLLIHGESGVGKELFAKAVHQSGPRSARPFVAVNCAALPENLIEAELFGYAGGAYTGARREGAPGRLREANGGTLFLDEIGDMPLAMQSRLLRVLQERVVQPLGSGTAVPVDFMLICATHRQLKEAVDIGRFRADLYYRINGLTLTLPPLRERRDFNRLVATLLDEFEPGRPIALAPAVAHAFSSCRWPGNLRQLANVLRTACAMLAPDETRIEWAHLPEDVIDDLEQPASTAPTYPENLHTQAEQTILRTIEAVHGNMAEAARRLGISRNTLYRRLQRMSAKTVTR
jgi:transcriptional regulator of acetoin/glycerol metabolism